MKKRNTRKRITSKHSDNNTRTEQKPNRTYYVPEHAARSLKLATKTRNIDYVFIICMQICVYYYLKRIQIWDKRKFISRYKSVVRVLLFASARFVGLFFSLSLCVLCVFYTMYV